MLVVTRGLGASGDPARWKHRRYQAQIMVHGAADFVFAREIWAVGPVPVRPQLSPILPRMNATVWQWVS
jgi:hypothetical protein